MPHPFYVRVDAGTTAAHMLEEIITGACLLQPRGACPSSHASAEMQRLHHAAGTDAPSAAAPHTPSVVVSGSTPLPCRRRTPTRATGVTPDGNRFTVRCATRSRFCRCARFTRGQVKLWDNSESPDSWTLKPTDASATRARNCRRVTTHAPLPVGGGQAAGSEKTHG